MARTWAAVGLLAVLVGCGPDGPRVVKVTGTVTRAGKPVPRAALTFTPVAGGRPSWGMADENGQYELLYTQDQKGALVGKHKVWVDFAPASVQEENDIATGRKKPPADQVEIKKKYGDEQTTPLVVEVKDDGSPVDVQLD